MAGKSAIKSFFGDSKNRTTIIFMLILSVGASILAYVFLGGGGGGAEEQASRTSSIPQNIDATPGSELPERYRDLQVEENLRRAEQAKKSGESALPTLVGGLKSYDFNLPNFQQDQENQDTGPIRDKGFGDVDPETQFQQQAQKTQQRGDYEENLQNRRTNALEEQERRRQARIASVERQRSDKDQDRQIEKLAGAMEGQMQAMFAAWNNIPKQNHEARKGGINGDDETNGTGSGAGGAASGAAGADGVAGPNNAANIGAIIKAGTVYYAVLDTAVNTDETGPILATVVQGPYRNAKLVGSITFNPGFKKVILNFTTMNVATLKNTVSINAVAIDPDTARTALASDVDNHYLLRYGSLFASSFLEGYGDVIKNAGTTTTTTQFSTQTDTPSLSSTEEIYSALGNVGKKWGEQISDLFNTPPTVTVDQGTGIGLLYLEDATVPLE